MGTHFFYTKSDGQPCIVMNASGQAVAGVSPTTDQWSVAPNINS